MNKVNTVINKLKQQILILYKKKIKKLFENKIQQFYRNLRHRIHN